MSARAPVPRSSPLVVATELVSTTEWNTFLAGCPNANFYQRLEWQRINEDCLGHRVVNLVARRPDGMAGALPLVHVRSRLFGNILCSMPYVNFGGPASLDESVEAALVEAACQEAERSGCDYLEIRSDRLLAGGLPASARKVSMTIALDRDPAAIWGAFKRTHRKEIRRAYKHGFQVGNGGIEHLDAFYALMVSSWRHLGTPLYDKAYFRSVLEQLPAATRIFIAHHGAVPVATGFVGFFRDTVEGMWAAVEPAARRYNPNYVLYWEMIKYACEHGYDYFHLGRSTAGSGTEQFKQKWNAEAIPLYWHYHLVRRRNLPELNVDNPRFRLAIALWRRLPPAIIRRIGPRIARSIP